MRNVSRVLIGFALLCAAILPGAASARAQSPAAVPALSGLPGYKAVQARYPESDAVVLFDSLVVSLDGENRVARRRHRAVMLFTDNAINRYGDPRILFDTATQELSVIAARVYMRDGTIVDTQKNGINQTTPFALDHAPGYADWQETVVTHVGIEKGCVAELHYVIRDKASAPWRSGVEIFCSEDPVQVRVLEIRGPGASNLKSASMNGAPAAEKTADGIWRWTVRDIAGRTPFDGGVWEGDYFPVVCYSASASWAEVLPGLAGLFAGKSNDTAYFAPIADRATKDLRSDVDKVLAIHHLALDCVSSIRAPFGLFAAAPRDARRIYESGYAGPLDRAVLLAAMLEAAGFDAVPDLVSAGKSWQDVAAAPEIFNAILVAVKVGDGELLLGPGTSYERDPAFGFAGRTLARLDGQCAIVHLPARDAADSRSSLDLVLEPGPDGGLAGSGAAVLTGLFSPYYLLKGTGSEAEDFVRARVKALFGGAELMSWNPQKLGETRTEIAFSFTVKLPDKSSGERLYLAMPRPFEAGLAGIDRVHPERSIVADAVKVEPCTLEVSCAIEPPKGWKIVALPRRSDCRNDVGSAGVSAYAAPEGRTVCAKTLVFACDSVRPADYAKLRSLIFVFGEDRIVLERE